MKRYFLTRSTREKTLLVLFVGVAALIWCLSAIGRARTLWGEVKLARSDAKEQQMWLANRATIEEQAARAAAQLDPARTLNGTRLVAEMNSLAQSAGLAAEVSGQRTERTTQFAFHSAQVSFRRAEMGALVKFYEELSKRSPYVGLEQVSIAADRASPGTLNASFRVVAAEIQR